MVSDSHELLNLSASGDNSDAAPGPEPPDSALEDRAAFALGRLRVLFDARQRLLAEPAGPDASFHLHLVDHALYSVYRDCIEAGALEEARRILAGHDPASGADQRQSRAD